MAYTAEKVITEVTQVDRNEFKLYEPKAEVDMLNKAVTIKKLSGTYSLARLERDKQQCEAEITDMQARIVDINNKIAAIENLITK